MPSAQNCRRQFIDHLPDQADQATWDDIMYELYVKQKVEVGLKAADEGRTVPHEVAKRWLLGDGLEWTASALDDLEVNCDHISKYTPAKAELDRLSAFRF